MPVDVAEHAAQAMEQMGVTDEDIQAQVVSATTPGGTPPAKETAVKPEEEEEVVEEVEEEEVEAKSVEGEEEAPRTVPITRFNKVYRELKDMERYLQAMVTEREQLIAEIRRPQPKTREEVQEEPDWDAMTPTEMARTMQYQTKQAISEVVREVMRTEVAPVKSSLALEAARKDMTETAGKYEDYWDYREPMITLANKHQDLTAEEVYFLASRNPKKVKESVTRRLQDTIQRKKKATTEKHSSPSQLVTQPKTYKNVKDIARAVAEKMGLDR